MLRFIVKKRVSNLSILSEELIPFPPDVQAKEDSGFSGKPQRHQMTLYDSSDEKVLQIERVGKFYTLHLSRRLCIR